MGWGALLGLVVGIAAAAADTVGGFDQSETIGALIQLTNLATTWSAVAFIAGRFAPTRSRAGAGGVASLVVAVAAYYLYGLSLGDRAGLDPRWVLPAMFGWLGMAGGAGLLFGLLGHGYRTGGRRRRWAAVPLFVLLSVECGYYLGQTRAQWTQGVWRPRDVLLAVLLAAGIAAAAVLLGRRPTARR